MKIDKAEILRALQLILAPGQVTELRALEATTAKYLKPHTVFGCFNDPVMLAEALKGIASAKGIYFTPNPVNPALLARAQNRLKDAGKGETTSDKDITGRRWLLVDCDAIRPAGISASDVEHKAALDRAMTIRAALAEMGWPEPIYSDSGNGGHLLYRVDLPADDAGLIEKCLDALADQHGTDAVAVDRSVHNPARIWKMYGSVACKGDNTAERPHRMARILESPAVLAVVKMEQLQELAAQAPGKQPTAAPVRKVNGHASADGWLDAFLQRNADKLPPMTGPEPYEGGRRWIFAHCPWNPDHAGGCAFLIQRAEGTIQAGCRHNSCANNRWPQLRAMIEPKAPPSAKPSFSIAPVGVSGIADTRIEQKAYAPFPMDVLPPVLADLVSEGAAALVCDPAQIALPALAACSIGIGNSRRIILKSSWKEPAVLWAAVVLPSGALKSPAMDLALDPIRTAQAKAIAVYKAEQLEYEARHGEWEGQKKALRGPEPTAPVCARIAVSDTTVEALADRLQNALRGLLCERDELAGWIGSFNQYKSKGGADLSHWLTMHRAGLLLMDRKTGDQKIIYAAMAFVAVAGTIQPGTLRRALTPEYRESGLAARLLLAMPPVKRRQWSDAVVSERVQKRYAAMLGGLLAIPMGGTLLEPKPVDIPMTSQAKAAWVAFYNAHNLCEQANGGGDLAAAWSKLEGYAARLALILHHVRLVTGEDADSEAVDLTSMAAGIALARWFAGEAERVYTMLGGDAETDEHAELVDLIQQRGGRITARELSRASRRFREDGTARDALCRLVEAGRGQWVELPPGKDGGRPVTVFEVVTQPPVLQGGDTGDGDKTPRHDSANEGYGTVTTVTGGKSGGYVTRQIDDRDWSAGDPDTASAKPSIPLSAIRETPRHDSASEGYADADTADRGVMRMADDDRDWSNGPPDANVGEAA